MKKFIRYSFSIIVQLIGKILNKILKYYDIVIIFRITGGIGDSVFITAMLENLLPKYKVILITRYNEFFLYNYHIWKLFKCSIKEGSILFKVIYNILFYLKGTNIIEPGDNNDEKIKLNLNLLDIATYNYKYLFLEKEWRSKFYTKQIEIESVLKKFSLIDTKYWLINMGDNYHTPNKLWDTKKFQHLIDELNFKWITIGTDDNELKNIYMDLRGQTSLRELVILISQAKGVVTTEGLISNISNAFDNVYTFLILTGYLSKKNIPYRNKNFKIITSNQIFQCSPCWLTNPCPYNFECSKTIDSNMVINEIIKITNV